MDVSELSLQDYTQFAQLLERQCGIVLGENKLYLVRSRLMPLVREFNYDSLTKLVQTITSGHNSTLKERAIDAMTTNETLWFRDRYPFDLLSNLLFPDISLRKTKVRIWSAACSSGQEPYSIAMLILEYKKRNPRAFPGGVEIVATDLSADMLKRASEAKYDPLSLGRGLLENHKTTYFTTAEAGHMQLKPEVRSLVTFKMLNLLESYASLGTFDVIFCRNVLIYFSQANKRKILQQIAASLQSQGALFLGASESLSDLAGQFDMIRCNPGLYYRKKA